MLRYYMFSSTLHLWVMLRYFLFSWTLHSFVMLGSCYAIVCFLDFFCSHASCYAIVCSLELCTHASCCAIVCSLELLHSSVMLRYCMFSWTFAFMRHATLLYFLLNFALKRHDTLLFVLLNFAKRRHATLLYVLLNFCIHASFYAIVFSLELCTQASCYAIVCSLELCKKASCYATVCSLEHASFYAIVGSRGLCTHASCSAIVCSLELFATVLYVLLNFAFMGHSTHPSVTQYVLMWCWSFKLTESRSSMVHGRSGGAALTKKGLKTCDDKFVSSWPEHPKMAVSCRRNDCFRSIACESGVNDLKNKNT